MQLKKINIGLLLSICILASACGYKFSGGGEPPGGIKSINIVTFQNRTSEVGVENTFTSELVDQFITNSDVMVTRQTSADAVMEGSIVAIRSGTIARKGPQSSLESRVYMTVDLKLTAKNGKVLWFSKGISEKEEYDVDDDKAQTESNKSAAIKRLSKKLAERVYNRLTDDF
ncbi:LPS assembly lipoprotein LptE [Desulfococcaceae bacterium HSG9]|nr:LPS assembly lipoprotein LptE [Desulfococcaceae bacterium HSG9]